MMLSLGAFETLEFESLQRSALTSNVGRLYVAVSGYERRSRAWAEQLLKANPELAPQFLVLGFAEADSHPNRVENDRKYGDYGIKVHSATSGSAYSLLKPLQERVQSYLAEVGDVPIEIHVDYSSMPRSWYCRGLLGMEHVLRPQDSAAFWYTPGTYQEGDYPSTGTDDFRVFTGSASLYSDFRTHLFGLGFDRVRAQAIWSVLDPQALVCFYADPAVVPGYVERVLADNSELLRAAHFKFTLPLADFVSAYGRLTEVAREFRRRGDVILVPDGPKPLILAASLVPLTFEEPGVVSFHVTRPRGLTPAIVAVEAAGPPSGFSFRRLVPEGAAVDIAVPAV